MENTLCIILILFVFVVFLLPLFVFVFLCFLKNRRTELSSPVLQPLLVFQSLSLSFFMLKEKMEEKSREGENKFDYCVYQLQSQHASYSSNKYKS